MLWRIKCASLEEGAEIERKESMSGKMDGRLKEL